MSDCAHILLVKEPLAGEVKTRLAAGLGSHGSEAAAELYQVFAADMLAVGQQAGLMSIVAYDPQKARSAVMQWLRADLYIPQSTGDLGRRMFDAFWEAFSCRPFLQSAVLTGSDLPDLPKEYLMEAHDALTLGQTVLGPSADGGYYLIGFPKGRVCAGVFEDVDWSTPQVLEQTLARMDMAGIHPHLLPKWSDVDDVDDLKALAERLAARPEYNYPDVAAHTRAALPRYLKMMEEE